MEGDLEVHVLDFNNRELAIVAWTGIVVLLMLRQPSLRAPLRQLLGSVMQRAILLPIAAFAAYIAALAWLGSQAGAWNWSLVNETVWWFLATGFVLLFGATRVAEEDDFFIRTAKRALTIAIFAEFFINLVVLPFWAEFLLVPVVTFIALVQVFVERKEEYAPVKKLADSLLSLIGLSLFAYVVISLISDPSQLQPLDGLRSLALPVVLTLLSLPLIYLFGLWLAYDSAFRWINFRAADKRSARQAKRLLLTTCHFRARRVGQFDRRWQNRLAAVSSDEEASAVVHQFAAEQAREAA